MKKLLVVLGIAAVLGLAIGSLSQGPIFQRPLSTLGLSGGVGYGTRVPVVTDDGRPPTDGEIFVIRNAGTSDPDLVVYSALDGGWNSALLDGTPATTFREDFTFGRVSYHVEEDFTAAVVTDVGENIIGVAGSPIDQIHYRFEAPGGPGFAGTLDPIVDGVLDLDNFTDDVDNEGLDLRFGGDPAGLGYTFNEDLNNSVYCEVSIRITDISEIDIFYFGWDLAEAYQDAGAYNAYNTYAFFTIEDAAGDLDIETEINGGGTLNDDTGTTWADGATHVMRVTMSADSVAFRLNNAAVTQTNAVLNADNGDEMFCGLGYVNATGDATPTPGIVLNYVEIGIAN